MPTEAQWEWACRAGTGTTYSFGEYRPGMNNLCNIADTSIAAWNYGRCEPGYSDGTPSQRPVGRYAANAWGLSDMHGNVAEWCLSTYRPYPYRSGRRPRRPGRAWPEERPRRFVERHPCVTSLSASRWRYQPYQPVYNVGFRVLVEIDSNSVVKTVAK